LVCEKICCKKNCLSKFVKLDDQISNQQRREIPWEKVPFVPRPSLIADPITAFGKKKSLLEDKDNRTYGSLVQRLKSEIVPKKLSELRPLGEYESPRDQTRKRVFNEIHRQQKIRDAGGLAPYLTDKQSMDVLLPKIHGTSEGLPKREFKRPIY